LNQLAALEVRRSDVPACECNAQAAHGGEQRIGRVGEGVHGRQGRAADLGGAEPVRPALQPEIRDQRQPRNVRGLGDLPDARQRRRGDGKQHVVHQKVRRKARPRSWPVSNAEVRPGIVEARERDGGLEVQMHVGMRGDERW